MEEAGGVYRLWLPLVPAVWLRGEIASAAEHIGAAPSRLATPVRRARRVAAGCTAVVLMLLPAALVPADAAEAPATAPPVAAEIREWSTPAPLPAVVAATAAASATAEPVTAPPAPHPRETEPASVRHVQQRAARAHARPPAAELHLTAPVRRRPAPRAARRHAPPPARLADVPASPLSAGEDPPAPVDDAPSEISPCPATPARPGRPPCADRPCAPAGSAPVPPFCRPCRPGGPPRPPGACPSRPCLPPAPAPTCPPRPLGPDRLRDGGEAAPGSPEGGRARPSP
jgi:translation initiation factor IF-2